MAYFGSSTHGNGRLRNDNQVVVHVLSNGSCHLKHVFQVGGAVFVGRCADSREYYLYVVKYRGKIGGEAQASRCHILLDQFVKSWFKDGNHVNTGNGSAGVGKASTRHQTYVACSNNSNVHN